jgi:diguanylate cyclase (GGDEF)-like protein/PAS domain S-box-containing protein
MLKTWKGSGLQASLSMKLPALRRIVAGFVLTAIISCGAAILLYRVAMQFQQNRQSIGHTRDVLDALRTLSANLEDAQTNARVYVLTGDASYLSSFNRAVATAHFSFDQLHGLVADYPGQASRLAELKLVVGGGLQILQHLVDLRRDQGMMAVLLEVDPESNRRAMDNIRSSISAMRDEENRLLDQGRQKYDANVRRNSELFASGIVVQFVLLLLVGLVFLRDASYRARAAREIEGTNARLAAILETTGDGIYQIDNDGRLVYLNRSGEKLLGYEQAELRGRNMHEVIHSRTPDGETRPAESCPFMAVLRNGISHRSEEEWYQRKDGTFISVECTSTPLRLDGEITGLVLSFHDITERKRSEAALRESEFKLREALTRERSAARVDFLTGIFNRRGFFEIAASESQRSRRYKRPLSLVYVDVDNFKAVNDSQGHDAGDELLVQIAAVVHSEVRGTDSVGRLGGDEFAVLLPETNQNEGRVVVEKLQKQLLGAMQERGWPVTFSIGLISFQVPPESIEDMVREADRVMYSVKLQGKNSVAMQRMN